MTSYKTIGTCSRQIDFSVKDNILTELNFIGGCAGNAKGLAKLAIGKNINEVIDLLSGIQCRFGTSCPDQLAKALIKYKKDNNLV